MKKSPIVVIFFILFVMGSLFFFLKGISNFSSSSSVSTKRSSPINLKSQSVMMLEINGIIMDSKKFLKNLKKYREEKDIKGFIIRVESPGGAVGPSQEIFEEIKKTRDKYKKPVVVFSQNLMASGAYYLAVGADKIVVSSGALVGSIGVIMEFANLEKLYDWAHISRFSITSGKFKDSGAEYRTMRDEEKQLFQDLINETYQQFRTAVQKGRSLADEVLDQYADGRVFTGETSVKTGFADRVGGEDEAIEAIADLAGIKVEDVEIVEPPKRRPSFFEVIMKGDEEADFESKIEKTIHKVLKTELMNKPLYLMPGAI